MKLEEIDPYLHFVEDVYTYEKSKIPFSYMLYAYSVKRAYRGTKPEESLG